MKLSIIIPVYNEKDTVLNILKTVRTIPLKNVKKEIILVDDFSKDGTRDILKKIKDKNIKVVFHEKNKGKGAALRTGFSYATGDLFIIQDADLEYDPHEYPKLLKPLLEGKYEVVYGSRFKSHKGHLKKKHMTYFIHSIGNKSLTLVTNLLYFTRLTDMETCYKVFTRNALKKIGPLRAKRFDFEPEITAKFLKKGFKIKEVQISYYSRNFDEGKKITWKDGIKALYFLVKYRFIN